MRLVSLVLGFLLVGAIAFAQSSTYEKVSDIEFKKIESKTETKETIYSIKELLNNKARVLEEIKTLKDNYKDGLKSMEDELAEIEKLILKAEELGIKSY